MSDLSMSACTPQRPTHPAHRKPGRYAKVAPRPGYPTWQMTS
jgi:hypothetical protein